MKTLSIFIVLLFISLNLYSQKISYSIETGCNYSFFTKSKYEKERHTETEVSSKGKTGFFLNNNFSFPLNKFIAFKTGLGFSLNNTDLTTTTKPQMFQNGSGFPIFFFNIYQIRIPLQLQLSFFNEKLLIASGISTSVLIHAENTPENNGTNTYTVIVDNNGFENTPESNIITYNTNNEFKNTFMNINFGVEYNIFNNVYAGVQYEYSATDLMKGITYDKIHLNTVSLNLSYKF